jgi:transposase
MPTDFPAWDRVYAFFRRWREKGLVKEFHDRLRDKAHEDQGRDPEPTAAIIDSQSVKGAASVPGGSRGYDGGKKINGRRRHVITDSVGLLLRVLVTAANVTDRQAATTPRPHKKAQRRRRPRRLSAKTIAGLSKRGCRLTVPVTLSGQTVAAGADGRPLSDPSRRQGSVTPGRRHLAWARSRSRWRDAGRRNITAACRPSKAGWA